MAFLTHEAMPNSVTRALIEGCDTAACTMEVAAVLALIAEFQRSTHNEDTSRVVAEAERHLVLAATKTNFKAKLNEIRSAEAILEMAWRWSIHNPSAPRI